MEGRNVDGLGRGGMGRGRVAPAQASFLNNHRGVVIHGDTRAATGGCFVFRPAFDASAR